MNIQLKHFETITNIGNGNRCYIVLSPITKPSTEERRLCAEFFPILLSKCRELVQFSRSSSSASVNAKVHGIKAGGEDSRSRNMTTQSQTAAKAVFSAGRKPTQPTLCWFAKDSNIINLINMRCSGTEEEGMTAYSFELNSSCAQSMSSATAVKIDAAVKGMGANSNFSSQSEQEHSRKMIFHIEF